MRRLRHLLTMRPTWFALLFACALAVRLIVPAGYMPATGGGRIALQLCPGTTSGVTAMSGMHHHKSDRGDAGKGETPCAFAGIGVATGGSADPLLVVAAVLFAFLLASRFVPRLLPATPGRLRPPLRAPPATA